MIDSRESKPDTCQHGDEDPQWFAEHPEWDPDSPGFSPLNALNVPPREAFIWCDQPATQERDELWFCDAHAAKRDRIQVTEDSR